MKCCIPLCNNFNSTFGIPKNAHTLWENAFGVKLKPNHRVCEKHFKKEDIIKTWVSGQGHSQYTVNIL